MAPLGTKETDPVIRSLHELGESVRWLTRATVTIFLVIAICFSAALYLRSNDLEQQNQQNREALQLLCSVSDSFDRAIVSAADQIRGNFENGTYERLLKAGLFTQEGVDRALATEADYRKTHLKLQHPVACDRIADGA